MGYIGITFPYSLLRNSKIILKLAGPFMLSLEILLQSKG